MEVEGHIRLMFLKRCESAHMSYIVLFKCSVEVLFERNLSVDLFEKGDAQCSLQLGLAPTECA